MGPVGSWLAITAFLGGLVFLLHLIDRSVARRKATPEQVRQADEKHFAGGDATVTVDLLAIKPSREQLARMALARGYAFESVDNRGKQGVYFTFAHKGPTAEPAPFLPESPHYAAEMAREARAKRRMRWILLTLCLICMAMYTVPMVIRALR